MRAGKLDRSLELQAYSYVLDEYGSPIVTYTHKATLRAQVLQGSTEEFLRAYGATDETVIVFRVRFLSGVVTSDRIVYEGRNFNIREIKEIGRRNGLDLRAEASE